MTRATGRVSKNWRDSVGQPTATNLTVGLKLDLASAGFLQGCDLGGLVWLPIEPALLLASDATLRPKRPRIMTASDRVLAAARRAQLSRPSRAE
jgi:hypothetical protein